MRRWIHIAAVAVLALGCQDEVTQFRGDLHATGAYPGRAVELNDIAWKYRAPAPIASAPASAHEQIYVVDTDGTLAALELERGEVVWEFELDQPAYAPLAAMGGRVLVGTDAGIRALSPEGEMQWSFDTDSPVDVAPLIWDSVAYFGTRGGQIHAVDAVGGALIWSATTAGPIIGEAVRVGKHVAVGSGDGRVYMLDRATGGPKWTWLAGAPVRGIAAGTDVVYVAAGTHVYAVEAAKPEVRWQFDVGGRVETPPTVWKSRVLVGNSNSQVVALGAQDGSQAWRFELAAPPRGPMSAAGNRLYVPTSREGITTLSPTGERQWTFRTDGTIVASPVPSGGRLYFADLAGSVYAIE
jgi:serine/threonine-protein kinase